MKNNAINVVKKEFYSWYYDILSYKILSVRTDIGSRTFENTK